MHKAYKVAALPGEGIGIEVIEAALKVLQHIAVIHDFTVSIDYGLIGKPAKQKLGSFLPLDTINLCENSDGILFGAVTKGGILELRKHFDFYVNLRPVFSYESLFDKSSLRPQKGQNIDILFIRELVSGIYFGPAGRAVDDEGEYGYHTMRYHDWEIRRVTSFAFKEAQTRRQRLTLAHKENALPHLHWRRIVAQVAVDFPEVIVEPMLIDNLAMQLVNKPSQFDVILAGNLFGDILSDIGGALVGSIGLLASASLNDQGLGLYEAVHGTAPDIAGKGIANPLGTIGALGLMLQQWQEEEALQNLRCAVDSLLADGYRTPDLHLQGDELLVNTKELVDRLIARLSTYFNKEESNT